MRLANPSWPTTADEALIFIEQHPVWPLMETTITPLTMFNDRRHVVRWQAPAWPLFYW
jgi:hypothetical protein